MLKKETGWRCKLWEGALFGRRTQYCFGLTPNIHHVFSAISGPRMDARSSSGS